MMLQLELEKLLSTTTDAKEIYQKLLPIVDTAVKKLAAEQQRAKNASLTVAELEEILLFLNLVSPETVELKQMKFKISELIYTYRK